MITSCNKYVQTYGLYVFVTSYHMYLIKLKNQCPYTILTILRKIRNVRDGCRINGIIIGNEDKIDYSNYFVNNLRRNHLLIDKICLERNSSSHTTEIIRIFCIKLEKLH